MFTIDANVYLLKGLHDGDWVGLLVCADRGRVQAQDTHPALSHQQRNRTSTNAQAQAQTHKHKAQAPTHPGLSHQQHCLYQSSVLYLTPNTTLDFVNPFKFQVRQSWQSLKIQFFRNKKTLVIVFPDLRIPDSSSCLVTVGDSQWIPILMIPRCEATLTQESGCNSASQPWKLENGKKTTCGIWSPPAPALCRSPPPPHPPFSLHRSQFWTKPILPLTQPHQPRRNSRASYFVPSPTLASPRIPRLISLAHEKDSLFTADHTYHFSTWCWWCGESTSLWCHF